MSTPLPLRARFTLLATLLGLLLSGLAAVSTMVMVEDYEYILATEILRGQAEDYGLRLGNGIAAELPRTQRLSGYRIGDPDLPAAYASYPPGVREDDANHETHVGVFDTAAGRLVFTIDLGDIEALETRLRLLVAVSAAAGTALAGWLGWLLSGIALAPLRRLAGNVEALPVEPRRTRLAERVSDDALGRLAAAIDDYQGRLVDADARQQAFFADASHELRTPIAVVQGATEVMLDDMAAEAHPRRVERLRRLERGVRELTDLIEILLVVSRHRMSAPETVDAAALLRDAVASLLPESAPGEVQIAAAGSMQVPRREALLLLRHAIVNLGWPMSGDMLAMRLRGTQLHIAGHAPTSAGVTPQRSDAGAAGALAQRLATQLGWRFLHAAGGEVVLELQGSTR